MKVVIYFIILSITLLIIAELGIRSTSFNKEGSFIMVFFYSIIVSGILSIIASVKEENK